MLNITAAASISIILVLCIVITIHYEGWIMSLICTRQSSLTGCPTLLCLVAGEIVMKIQVNYKILAIGLLA